MQYSEKELTKLIEDVEKEFASHLAKAEETVLVKSEDSEPKKDDKKEAKEDKGEEKHEPAEHKEHAEHEHEEHEHHEMDPEEKEYMDKMYHSMSKGELKAHHDSIRSAMGKSDVEAESDLHPGSKEGPDSKVPSEEMEVQKSEEDGIESSKPANSPGPKSEASKANGEKINKSEHERRNGGKIEAESVRKSPGAKSEASDTHGAEINKSESTSEVSLLKSEVEAEKAKNEELKKNFEAVTEFLTKLVKKTAPQGKAITSMDVIAKSESSDKELVLSKKEITTILTKKTADSNLAKSDRELINAYYNGASLNSIAHLLK